MKKATVYIKKSLISILALSLCIYQFIVTYNNHKGLDTVVLGLFIIAILPWLTSFIKSIEAFGIKAELSAIKEKQDEQDINIELIMKSVIDSIISPFEKEHLNILNQHKKHNVNTDNNNFKSEMEHLLTLKFIDRKPGKGINTLFNSGKKINDINEHFYITDRGKKYLDIINMAKKLKPKKQ